MDPSKKNPTNLNLHFVRKSEGYWLTCLNDVYCHLKLNAAVNKFLILPSNKKFLKIWTKRFLTKIDTNCYIYRADYREFSQVVETKQPKLMVYTQQSAQPIQSLANVSSKVSIIKEKNLWLTLCMTRIIIIGHRTLQVNTQSHLWKLTVMNLLVQGDQTCMEN